MLTHYSNDQREPKDYKNDVREGKRLDAESQLAPDKYQKSRKCIPRSPEETVDRGLGFVFGFTAGWQEERLPRRVLNGVIGAVFRILPMRIKASSGKKAITV